MTHDQLTVFGLFAVSAMIVCYELEQRSHWFILAFAFSCGLGSIYGFLQGAWPFGVAEAFWGAIAFRKWRAIRLAADDQLHNRRKGQEETNCDQDQ
jgi:hypothetical protein